MKNEIDTAAATDLKLTIENDSRVYPKRLAIETNLRRKVEAMRYDASKAPAAWMYFVDDGAKLYSADFPPIKFNRATRLAVATELAREFEAQLAMELQAAMEGAVEEERVCHNEATATGKYRAWQRYQVASREASEAIQRNQAFTTAIKEF